MEEQGRTPSPKEAEERLGTLAELEVWLRMPMLLLSALWLALVVAELAWGTSRLLETLGTIIWVTFLGEFALRLALAPDRRSFLRANWLSIIALIAPAFRLLRGFRLLRFARATRGLRLVRVVGSGSLPRECLAICQAWCRGRHRCSTSR